MSAKTPTPTPIPAFAPPVNPLFLTLISVGVPELVEMLCEVAAVDEAVVEEVVEDVVVEEVVEDVVVEEMVEAAKL
jgi:hypothetical protein